MKDERLRSRPKAGGAGDEALAGFLRRLLLVSRLSDEEQAAILSLRTQVHQVAARSDQVVPDRVVSHAILVADGLLGRFDLMRDGARQITALHIPGDMCDLHSVPSPRPGWGITALTSSTVIHIPHDELRARVARYPNIAQAFWRDTTLDGSILAKAVANMGRKDARARIAHLLCEMGVRMERAGLAARRHYRLPIRQDQLGDALGLTGVHVNRMLRELRTAGLVAKNGDMVEIADWEGLAAVAEFSPAYLLCGEPPAERLSGT